MRVAIVTESFLPTINGVTNSVCKVLDHLALRGHEAIVICPTAGAPKRYKGFRIHEVPTITYRQFPVGVPNMRVQKLLDDFAPDIVHVASPMFLGAEAIAAAKRRGIGTVAIFQTDVAGYTRRNNLAAMEGVAWQVIRWIHNGADLNLAPSSVSIADLQRARVGNLKLWGRGVDLESYHPRHRQTDTVARLRQRITSSPNEVVIGYVGRVAPEKQVERLAALRGIPNIKIVIVGDGPSMDSVKKALKGMPVHYAGKLSGKDLSYAYASFDIFVHTGTEETFGQTIQEAHAAGLPVVAPYAGGPIDLIGHGEDGYLFDPFSESDAHLRRCVEHLVANADARARMGEAGRRRVLDRSWESVCDELLGDYGDVITKRRGEEARERALSLAADYDVLIESEHVLENGVG